MWERKFQRKILDRGFRYYIIGRVELDADEEDYAICYVSSDSSRKKYEVIIDFDDYSSRDIAAMSCDCPYALEGHNCKHMAAALYYLEDNSEFAHAVFEKDNGAAKIVKASKLIEKREEREKFVPLFDASDFEYQYYDLPSITSELKFTSKVVADAKELFNRNSITLDKIFTDFRNGYFSSSKLICHATGTMHQANGLIYDVNLSMDNTDLIRCECGVHGCYCRYDRDYYYNPRGERGQICQHGAALILAIREYQKNHILGDATDETGLRILDMFRVNNVQKQLTQSDIGTIVGAVDVEPRLIKEGDALHLSFKIGYDKLYVMKSIKDFYNKYINKETLSLGKNTTINFATAQFTERGQRYVDFISREVKQEFERKERIEQSARTWYRPEVKTEGMSGFLDLYGTRLDDFFEHEEGNAIAYVDKDAGAKEVRISFKEEKAKAYVSINAGTRGGALESILVYGELPVLFEGSRYQYFMSDTALCRLDEESKRNLEPLNRLAEEGHVNLRIGRNNIAEFYYRVLPELEKCAQVENNVGDLVEEFLPREMDVIYYLDAEKDALYCRPVARYAEEKVSLLDMLVPENVKDHSRDRIKEKEALDVAMRYFPEIRSTAEEQLLFCDNDEDMVYRLLDQGLSQLMLYGEVHCTDRFKSRNVKRSVKVSVGVSVQSSIMDLEISTEDVSPEELLEILDSYKKKKRYHRLKNGDFIDITDDSIKELSAMMDSMHIKPKEFVTGKMHLPLYRALYLDKMLESCQEIYTSRDSHFRNLVKGFKTVSDADYEVPEYLRKTLRNYQKYGFKWMKVLENNNFGGILADDMGLGKTLQTISVLAAEHEDKELASVDNATVDCGVIGAVSASGVAERMPSLIVCPASLVYNWLDEFARFAPQLTVSAVSGKAEERAEVIASYKDYDVIVTSYDLLKRDIAEYEGKEFNYEIIDEAQYIKTHTTAAAKSVKLIQSRNKLALTGTPIENRLSELWSIFDYLMPGFLYSYDVFKKEIETPIVKQKDEDAINRLKRMVSPFILRRLKGDVLKDLPDKIEELQYAHMDDRQQELYDAQVTHMKEVIQKQDEESFKKNKIQILAELTRIRQICCDPSLMVENYKGESAKREACLALIERAMEGEHKMLIFSQFTSMLDILAAELDKRGIPYYSITGATAKEKRLEYVKAFNSDDVPVFLISLKAGGTGLNLTGADVVIHYDPWWNVAAQNQATDRAHRIGQSKIVTVYKLIVKGSIEEKIVKMQEDKADLANEILSGENGSIVNMTKEDLLELL